jgi:fimbrial chaperone protein
MSILLPLLLLISLAPVLLAGSFGVSPIRAELTTRRPTTVIHVENRSDVERDYQLEPVLWRQTSGVDEYLNSPDLIVVPPRFRLKPGGIQTVRIGTQLRASPVEQSFRLYIQELPVPLANDPQSAQIQTLLRVSIPVFLEPDNPRLRANTTQQVLATFERRGDGSTSILLRNQSAFHVQVQKLRLTGMENLDLNRYILPGQQISIPVKVLLPTDKPELELEALTDQGRIHVPSLQLEKTP